MAIAFPNTASDFSVGSNASSFTLPPPTNTANGDLLIAIASGRDSPISGSAPTGWSSIVSNVQSNGTSGLIGETNAYYMTVPTVSSLPSNWTWSNSEARWSVMILRVTGVNLTSPIVASGTFTGSNSDGQHIAVSSVSSSGAAFMSGTTYFDEVSNDPAGATINGWGLLQNYGMTSAQAGRQACVTYGGPDGGSGSTTAFTLDITNASQWNVSAEASPQAAIVVLGLNAIAGPVMQPMLSMTGII